MLDVPYAPDVPRAMIDVLEHHARRLGVPLDAVERIGSSLELVEGFVLAAEAGWGLAFAEDVRVGVTPVEPAVRLTPEATPRSRHATARARDAAAAVRSRTR